ncbi:hypothetical protein OAT68_01410 [Flavobacteriaceae bacterium]|nr:hypothetical protein [Flavobacteriaceae bacterium]
MKTFKKQLVSFDEAGYKRAIEDAKRKIETFNQALSFAEKHIVVFDKEEFARNFVEFFKSEFHKVHQEQNTLGLSPDKLLFVKEVDLTRLNNLQRTFKDDESAISFDTTDGKPKPDIDKTQFEVWTKSPEQNERLKIGQTLIDALRKASAHTKIYPLAVQQATSNLVMYNVRTNDYTVNIRDF